MATTYTDSNISQFVINKLTKNEFKGITPDPDQLYLLPETVSDTVIKDDPNPVSGGAVFNAIKDALPSKDKWEVVETLTNNSSSVVSLPFSVPEDGFYLLMIGGTNDGNNCMARLLTPAVSPFGSTLPIASAVMIDGYGSASLCYLFSGYTYNFQLTEVTETTTAKIIRLS